jgi:hypothetical protein
MLSLKLRLLGDKDKSNSKKIKFSNRIQDQPPDTEHEDEYDWEQDGAWNAPCIRKMHSGRWQSHFNCGLSEANPPGAGALWGTRKRSSEHRSLLRLALTDDLVLEGFEII